MGRSESYRPTKPKVQRLAPKWRGVGCVLLLVFTVGAYWLGGFLLSLNQKTPFIPVQLPANFGFTVGPIEVPVGIAASDPSQPPKGRVVTVGPVDLAVGTVKFFVSWFQLALTVVVDIVAYVLMFIIYSLANPPRLGPTDAPPVRPKKGRGQSLVR